MYFEEYGDKKNPTVLLLHGAMAFYSLARQQELSDGFHLIFYTLPGHGPDSEREFDRSLVFKEVMEIIKKTGKNKVNIVGFSLGAQLVLSLINNYPQYFDKAVIISPLIDSTEAENRRLSLSTRVVGYTTKLAIVSKVVSRIIGLSPAKSLQFAREQKNQKVTRLSAGILKDMLKSEDLQNIEKISTKVLILAGEKELPSFIRSAKFLSKKFRHCTLEFYGQAGHNIPYKFYKRLNPQLRAFFGK